MAALARRAPGVLALAVSLAAQPDEIARGVRVKA